MSSQQQYQSHFKSLVLFKGWVSEYIRLLLAGRPCFTEEGGPATLCRQKTSTFWWKIAKLPPALLSWKGRMKTKCVHAIVQEVCLPPPFVFQANRNHVRHMEISSVEGMDQMTWVAFFPGLHLCCSLWFHRILGPPAPPWKWCRSSMGHLNYLKEWKLTVGTNSYANRISTIPPTIKTTYGNLFQIRSWNQTSTEWLLKSWSKVFDLHIRKTILAWRGGGGELCQFQQPSFAPVLMD